MDVVINYTLPAIQLVCHLVAPGNSGIEYVRPGPAAVTQSPPQYQPTTELPHQVLVSGTQTTPQLQSTTLPDGYVKHPDIGVAYKVYENHVSLIEASNICTKEGAQLALIDSAEKKRYFTNQSHWSVYAGIVRLGENEEWVSFRTGLPVASIPWASGYPDGDGNCVTVSRDQGITNHACNENIFYACELPILTG